MENSIIFTLYYSMFPPVKNLKNYFECQGKLHKLQCTDHLYCQFQGMNQQFPSVHYYWGIVCANWNMLTIHVHIDLQWRY